MALFKTSIPYSYIKGGFLFEKLGYLTASKVTYSSCRVKCKILVLYKSLKALSRKGLHI